MKQPRQFQAAGFGDYLFNWIVGGFLLLVLPGATSLGQDTSRLDQIVQSYVHSGKFMGAVLVARGPEVLLDKGYGSANLEWDIPNSPATKFRLGSLTKQFTAASILLLADRGKIDLQAPARMYLPDAPPSWDGITIFHLLTHTSGIPNFTDFPDYRSWMVFPTTARELVARLRNKPLDFRPGEKWSYSNSGYAVLGYVIETITGESYATFVTDNIFTPLAMKDSGYDSNAAIIPRRAAGYSAAPSGPVNAGLINMTVPFSAGGLYSTTEDLWLWEQSLFGGKLLSASSFQKMTTPFKNDYGMGLTVHTVHGHAIVDHTGAIAGFNNYLAYYPDDHVTVAVLANLSGPAAAEIGLTLGAVIHGQVVKLTSERKAVLVAPAQLATYRGVYELRPGFDMTVTLEDGHLMIQATGQQKFELYAESPSSFFLTAVDAQVDFEKDATGAVTYLVLHQGGRDAKATRK